MELIPILSLIILVATISTFILAVGAYILYKIRERKGRQQAAQPASIPAELIAPAPIMTEQAARRTTGRRTYTRDTYQEPIYAPTRETGPQLRPTFVGGAPPTFTEASRYQRTGERERVTADTGRYTSPSKFMRYTNEGYVEPAKRREEKKDDRGSLKWR